MAPNPIPAVDPYMNLCRVMRVQGTAHAKHLDGASCTVSTMAIAILQFVHPPSSDHYKAVLPKEICHNTHILYLNCSYVQLATCGY